jgi:phosphoribosylaminoimidazole-succinocarboxamide synthase
MTPVALPHRYTGKVRDLYEVGADRTLMVASDRISVFDVVLGDEIPDKGRALTALSAFWFERTRAVAPNHLISADPTDFPDGAGPEVAGRALLVRSADPVRLECIARGYLFGSAWDEYDAATRRWPSTASAPRTPSREVCSSPTRSWSLAGSATRSS